MQVLSSGKVPVHGFASGGSAFQNLHQKQTGEIIGIFFVIAIFKGCLAGGRYKLPQGGPDPVLMTVDFHAAFLYHLRKQNRPEAPRLVFVTFVLH